MHWIYLSVAILAEVIATSALKQSDGFTKLMPSFVAIGGFSAALYLLSLTLKSVPVGIAYAIWAGVGIVLISLIGLVFFKQTLDAAAIAGIAMIVGGVIVINTLSSATIK